MPTANKNPHHKRNLIAFSVALLLLLLLAPGRIASAATFTVNTFNDDVDANIGNGICAAVSGECSLRAAIQEANASAGADVINVPAGTYILTNDGSSGEDLSATGDLDVNSEVEIVGAGVGITIIDGNGSDRVFDLFGSTDATIRDLTITNGSAPFGAGVHARAASDSLFIRVEISGNTATNTAGSGGGGIYASIASVNLIESEISSNTTGGANGGGIYSNNSTLLLDRSVVTNNLTPTDGGAIFNSLGDITVNQSTFTANIADDDGGAIFNNNGTITVDESTFTNNEAKVSGGADSSNAGAIGNVSGTVNVTRSLFNGNFAKGRGGAIANFFAGATFNVENSTFSGNESELSGGAAYNNTESMTLTNNTIVNNIAPTGAGIASLSNTDFQEITLRANIIEGNSGGGNDIDLLTGTANTFQSIGFNLIGTVGSHITLVGTDETGVPTQVDSLANNGGETLTHDLLVTSTAIDKITSGFCPATDQRGTARPQGANCDSGAVEMALPTGNIQIVAGTAFVNMIQVGQEFQPTTASGAQIGVNNILAALNSGDVTIHTGSDAGGDLNLGTITWTPEVALDYNGIGTGKTLELRAADDIIFQGGIIRDGTAGGDSLNVVFGSDVDDVNGGGINGDRKSTSPFTSITIETNGGEVILSGGSGTIADLRNTGSALSSDTLTMGVLVSGKVDAAGGDITIRGQGQGAGIQVFSSNADVITTGSGSITMTGTGDGSGNLDGGVVLSNAILVRTQDGDINIDGIATTTAGASTANGVSFLGDSILRATGSGNIFVTGTASVAADIRAEQSSNISDIIVNTGNATLTGDYLRLIRIDIAGGDQLVLQSPADADNLTLEFSQTELLGFNQTTIGRTNGSGLVTVNGAFASVDLDVNTPLLIQAPAVGGAIDLTGINSIIGGSNASDIVVTASGNVDAGKLENFGRNITITSNNGNINATGGIIDTGAAAGAGDIALNAPNGSITTANLSADADVSSGAATSGNAGQISLVSNGDISAETVVARARANDGGTVGNGGDVSITSNNGNIIIRSIDTRSERGDGIAGNSSNAGDVTVSAPNGSITLVIGGIDAFSDSNISGNSGDGGNITLTAGTTIDAKSLYSDSAAPGGSAATAGDINVTAGGDIVLSRVGATAQDTNFTGVSGSVNIDGALVRITDTNANGTSIDTLSNVGAPITITHDGNGVTPFIVGDAATNGTVGTIRTGFAQITPSQSFAGSHTEAGPPDINIVTTAVAQTSPYTVNTTDEVDDGLCSNVHCSLREAINAANSTMNGASPDEIHFDIAGAIPHRITPATGLPVLSESVNINGYTQPGSATNTLAVGNDAVIGIEIDGALLPTAAYPDGSAMKLTSGGSTIAGLSLINWNFNAIQLGSNAVITGNYIGVDAAGTAAGNGEGVTIGSTGNTVGGNSTADRNIISSNTNYGVGLNIASLNNIVNNYIGTDPTGTLARPNGFGGIGSFGASSNTRFDDNVISGNNGNGITLSAFANANKIRNNIIGLTAAGDAVLPNQGDGLASLGTSAEILDNTIAGNTGEGIVLSSDLSIVQRNLLGTNASGDALGNGSHGIGLRPGATDIQVGGAIADMNTIAFNGGHGIALLGNSDTISSSAFRNEIYSNDGLGIDIGGDDKVDSADFFDNDTGPNGLQNAPTIQRVIVSGTETTIQGFINSSISATFSVDFYVSSSCDPSGFGEGETFFSTTSVATDAIGHSSFQLVVPNALNDGDVVSAVALDSNGRGSEFSRCIGVSPNNDTWPNAFEVALAPQGSGIGGSAEHSLDNPGQARWYRFPVAPNSKVIVDLNDLPANYDLVVFRDIAKTYDNLLAPQDLDELTEINAEFAPEAFTPEAFTPEAFTPEAFTPEAFTPEAFTPEAFTPEAFTPEAFTPEAFTPEAFTPEAFTPEAFTPEAFTPEAFTPEAFTPEAFTPEAFTPDMVDPGRRYFAAAQAQSAIAVSSFDGNANEMVIANSWGTAGDFYVRVDGRNGVFAPTQDFTLDVTVLGNDCVSLTDFGFTPDVSGIGAGSAETIILVDYARMAPRYPSLAAMQTALGNLATQANAVIVDVSDFDAVNFANTQADANVACVYAKNLVAYTIKDIVDAYRATNPIEYVVVVGHDDIIPFFRYPDRGMLANEDNYVPPVRDDTASQASLRSGYILSQDTYGSSIELDRRNTTLPVPELAVGRLVETPDEVISSITAFLSTGGIVPTPSSALVTGYDFLDDAAAAVEAELAAGLGNSVDTLVSASTLAPSEGWTADDLSNSLLNSGRHDLVFLAGHFSAFSTLAADYETRLLASDVANSSVDMTNSIIFSAGCHSGYNIVNEDGIANVTINPDWAQAFAQKGAVLIAGTGYQYGDTDFVEYSERLYLEFSEALREGSGPVSVGNALVRAKQVYLAETAQMRPIHEKVLLQSTIFGLPMLSIDMPSGRITPTVDTSIVSVLNSTTVNPGLTLGLQFADVSLVTTPVQQTLDLENLVDQSTVTTVYYEGSDGRVINPGEPILPLERNNVSAPGTVARGLGFRGGSYNDVVNQIPLNSAATTELRGVHSPFISSVFYPLRTWELNYFDVFANSAATGSTQLAVIPAQYRSNDSTSAEGTFRIYDDMDFRMFYSGNIASFVNVTNTITNTPALAAPPSIVTVLAEENGTDVDFSVEVTGDPSAGIQEVWVVWTACDAAGVCNGTWAPVDLTQDANESTLWTGSVALGAMPSGDLLFMAQAVNGVGLVSLDMNKGEYYSVGVNAGAPQQPIGELEPAVVPTTTLSLVAPPTVGVYGTQVMVEAQLMQGTTPVVGAQIEVGLGTQRQTVETDANGIASATLSLLNVPTTETLQVSYAGSTTNAGSADSVPFTINPIATTLTLATTTPTFGANQEADLTLELRDAIDRPLREKAVLIVINDGSSDVYAEAVITNLFGDADLISVPLAPGSYTVNAYFGSVIPFNGDSIDLTNDRYLASTTDLNIVANTPPVADAGTPASVDEGSSVELDASGSSDVNTGQELTYAWDLDNDGSYETTGITATVDASAISGPASLTVGLEVCDVINDCDTTTTTTVTVNNIAPTIMSVSNNGPVDASNDVTISVSATDPVDALSYEYDCDGDNVFEVVASSNSSNVCTLDAGSYMAQVRVNDGSTSVISSTTITVNEDPSAISLATSSASYVTGDTVIVSATLVVGTLLLGLKTIQLVTSNGVTLTAVTDVNGVATFSLPNVQAGSLVITTEFAGDGDYLGSSAEISLTVGTATSNLTITSDASSYTVGDSAQISVTLEANGNGLAGETITLVDDNGVAITTTTDANGVAVFSVPLTMVGNGHIITANFAATGGYSASGDSFFFNVTQAATSLTLTTDNGTYTEGDTANLTATLADAGGVLSGQPIVLTTSDAQTFNGTTGGSGVATFSVPGLAAGSLTFTADFAGDATNLASSAGATVTVSPLVVSSCDDLYPIAISYRLLEHANAGDQFNRVRRGYGYRSFTWLTWDGQLGAHVLANSLTPPGDSVNFVNPFNAADTALSVSDWSYARYGAPNNGAMQTALDALVGIEIVVPVKLGVWGYQGNSIARNVQFARIVLNGYKLNGRDKLSFEFLGFEACSSDNAPVAVGDYTSTRRNQAKTFDVLWNDFDIDGDVININSTSTPYHGSVQVNGDNTITYTPDYGFRGTDWFSYTIEDGNGNSSTTWVSVYVWRGGHWH